jgi:predicted amidohydrolase YtcJ
MKTNSYASVLVAALFLSGVAIAENKSVADKIITSAHVLTLATSKPEQTKPLAIAVKGDRIIWVGEPAAMTAWQGKDTQVIDYGDQAILPGFIDAHGHVSFSALATNLANVASPPVGPVTTISDLQTTLREYLTQRDIPQGEWIVGMGYDDSLITEGRHPDRDDLDAVSTNHPIMLVHVSGHLIATNSRGLARAGLSAESPNPAGGIIRRRANSMEPDGVLEETATYALRQQMNTPNSDPLSSVTEALLNYASYGITTAQDGAASAEVMALLSAAAAQNKLPLDVVAYPLGQADPDVIATSYTWGVYENRLKVAGIKLILDGSPQGKTAYLSHPYHVPPAGQSEGYAGYPTIDALQTSKLVGAYLNKQIPILAHANGDAAADMLINAVAEAQPQHDHRTVMIHAQTVREDQLTRMKTLRMIPSYFSAHTFYWGDWHRDSVLGPERASRISPTASTQQRGMVFTVHNDAPIVPPDMVRLLWATTNRKTRSDQVLGAEQRISTLEALRAMTIYAAYQMFEEADKGSIEVGKLADLVVLSADPVSMAPADLLDLTVNATYSRGERVFSRVIGLPQP